MPYERFLKPNPQCRASMTCPSMASSPDRIRVYKDDQGGLSASIVIANDVANLYRYVKDYSPPLFGEPAECEDDIFSWLP
jgi:hypothetical protein